MCKIVGKISEGFEVKIKLESIEFGKKSGEFGLKSIEYFCLSRKLKFVVNNSLFSKSFVMNMKNGRFSFKILNFSSKFLLSFKVK